jgi:hypothetical protein
MAIDGHLPARDFLDGRIDGVEECFCLICTWHDVWIKSVSHYNSVPGKGTGTGEEVTRR